MSLRLRLVLLVLIPSLPLFVLALYSSERQRASDLDNARIRLTMISQLGAAELRAAVENGRDVMSILAQMPGLAEGDPTACKHAFQELLQGSGRFGALFVTDRHGRALCHSAPLPGEVSYADRAYFRRARDTGQFVVGEALIGRLTGKALLGMAQPLKDARGEFRGILFLGYDLRWFGDRFGSRLSAEGVTFGLWGPDGTILYRYPDPDRWIGRRVADAGIARAVASRQEEMLVSDAVGLTGRPTMYAITGTEKWSATPISVTAGIEKSALEVPADAVFRRSMAASATVFALALAAAIWLGESGIRRRAVAIAGAARRMAAGDLSARSALPPSTDELGGLSDSFDRMAVTLDRRTRALRVLSAVNQALVHAGDEDALLREACRIVVEDGGFASCWVGYPQHDEGRRVTFMAQYGIDAATLAGRKLSWGDVEGGRGPVGRALREGKPVVIRNIEDDTGEGSSREFALQHGYRAYAAFPIRTHGEVLGMLGINARERGRFDEHEVAVLEELADDLGFGIQAMRDRAAVDRHAAALEDMVAQRTGELQAANRFLDSIVEIIPQMIFVKDAATLRFVRFNRAGEELLGYRREELIGKGDADFFPPDQARHFVERDRAVLAGGRMVEIEEEPVQTRCHGTRYLHTRKVPILDEGGSPRYLLGISEDITERKERAREILALNAVLGQRAHELAEVNRELEAFSYSVSHDLRAPLRHIQGYVELLSASAADALPEKGQRYLRIITEAAGEMGQLIDDLLAFSRTARTEPHHTEVDMDELVRTSMEGLEMMVRDRNIEWRIGPLPRVRCDAALMRQVWANLLGNAVKYTRRRDPAVIEVGAAERPNSPLTFFVRDNGVGFDMAHARKLFGVFQRLHRAEDFEGTGIGLATVQRIVSRHGGRIWADAAPERGATFHFTLGVPQADAGESTEPRQ
ncbi:MAG TPA: GAF domain-containing protein [Usitatibacter sp.]|nr:GAF domain-containing protein [Usitatibacter sp.]